MSYLKPNIITDRGITQWTNEAARQINSGQLVHSNDISIVKTPHGTRFKIKRRHKLGYEDQYKSDFNPDAGYIVGDVVRVMPAETYIDRNGVVVAASVGVWKCVSSVPDGKYSDALLSSGLNLNNNILLYYCRQTVVEYFPKDPEPDTVAFPSVEHPESANGRYWECIGMLPCG